MKTYTQHHISKLICFLLIAASISCADFLDVDTPKTELGTSDVFGSDMATSAAMAGIYTNMSLTSGGTSSLTYAGGMLADETASYSTSTNTIQLYTNNIIPTNTIINDFWGNSGYYNIYQVNAVLDGMASSPNITPALKTQLEGEALFLRAFHHFNLVNLFGPIPYITTTDYRSNNVASRISVPEVYQHIIDDLKAAQLKLSTDYSFSGGERIKPSKSAATALLARVYLFIGNDTLAEEQATAVITNSGTYSLSPLAQVFLKNSSEAIWQLKPVLVDRNTNEGSTFILTAAPRFSALRDDFMAAFETNDQRRTSWTSSIVVSGIRYYYPFKYKIRTGASPLNEYSMVLRLAEQYLIRAEARANQNKLASAIDDVDAIRQRAGLPLIKITNPSISKDNLLVVIQRERRMELFTEWGHRWFDLKRLDRATTVLGPLKTGWQPTDALLPLPGTEVLVNSNLSQNPGY